MRPSSEDVAAASPAATRRAGGTRRLICKGLALVMALFALVQVNDPDGALWCAVYGATALWCALGAVRPDLLRRGPARALLALSLLAALAGMAAFWPQTPGWWRQEVWWETESAREGMGLMIAALTLLAPASLAWSPRRGDAA